MSRTTADKLDLGMVRRMVDDWYALKRQAALIGEKVNAEKSRLKAIVERYGEVNPENGSFILELDEPVGDRKIFKLTNQCRSAPRLNAEKAERILRRKGIWQNCTKTVEIPDSEKIHAAYYDKLITDSELAQMFPRDITWAFVVLDDNGKPVS